MKNSEKPVSIPIEATIGGLLVGLGVLVISLIAHTPEPLLPTGVGLVSGAILSAFFGYLRNTSG